MRLEVAATGGDEQRGLASAVAEREQREPGQPDDRALTQVAAAAAGQLQVELAVLEDDQRVAPVALVKAPLAAGWDDDGAAAKRDQSVCGRPKSGN
jgi:hypothetical protein